MKKYENMLKNLILSNAKVIEVTSHEWQRVHGFVNFVSHELNRNWYVWSAISGIKKWTRDGFQNILQNSITLKTAIDFYLQAEEDMILILEDYHHYLSDNYPANIRLIREMMRPESYMKKGFKKALILSSPMKVMPEDLSKELPLIEVNLPNIDELHVIAKAAVLEKKDICKISDISTKLLESALGLTIMEATLAFNKAILSNNQLTEVEIPLIIAEKEQVIKKTGILEYYHPKTDLNHVGGLETLKEWIKKRGKAYEEKAKSFGLNNPRGMLLLGIPGCGKSLTAKAISQEWQFPLLRFDLGRVFTSYIGESEQNMRKALDIAETISPCVLWLDEIEKGLSGTGSSDKTDGGTSARVFGSFLTWMQEKTKPVFVVATANQIDQLPPELLRKGRFDEIFFVDLPSYEERIEIFKIHLSSKKQKNIDHKNIIKLVEETEGYSGAEIEEVINEAMYDAFYLQQEYLEVENISKCIQNTLPLSRTKSDEIIEMRKFAQSRARFASNTKPASVKPVEENFVLYQETKNPFI